MNQIIIGKFIATSRKAKGLTQKQLADILSISDKTVSKWERGSGLPEVSLMLPLCKALGINVNELLSGERLDSEKYFEKAEENMVTLVKDTTSPKIKVIISTVACVLVSLSALALVLIAGFAELHAAVRLLLIAIALVVICSVVAVTVVIAVNTEIFECEACGEKFVPTLSSYIMGPHTLSRRYLKCPHCGKKSWNKSNIRQ